ncbi:ATP-binding cassette domain-containing protein [Wukongibacter baidiensis]|uniref:ABC transporter ATP-binding protein n=1 Tax=Wukongibacter baidiensis TaxID=1723361 RepID=UPI003D7FC980
MKAIEVKNLKRNYCTNIGVLKREKKIVNALKGISFDVKKGEIFGLLGPNGAGKTTTIKILTTLLTPTSGEAKVLGYNCFGDERKLRKKINFIFGGERSLYWRLSAWDNLSYFCDLYGIEEKIKKERIENLLDLVGLTDKAHFKVESFSKGMKQRLQIARGLVNDPEVLFLDEPTIGLDPSGAKTLRYIIRHLSDYGKTIVLTTHYMHEADELCDRIAVINNGEIIALDKPENLKENLEDSVIEIKMLHCDNELISEIGRIDSVTSNSVKKIDNVHTLNITCKDARKTIALVNEKMSDYEVLSIGMREATLEDVYLKMIEGDQIA